MILLLFVPLAIALIPSEPHICKSLIREKEIMGTVKKGGSHLPKLFYKAGIVNEK